MQKLIELYKQWKGAEPANVSQIPGGGSTRTYFRLTDQNGQSVVGVIDPAKVARVALENAASIAGMFLTTECLIVDKPEKEPAMPMGGAPGMGGMM